MSVRCALRYVESSRRAVSGERSPEPPRVIDSELGLRFPSAQEAWANITTSGACKVGPLIIYRIVNWVKTQCLPSRLVALSFPLLFSFFSARPSSSSVFILKGKGRLSAPAHPYDDLCPHEGPGGVGAATAASPPATHPGSVGSGEQPCSPRGRGKGRVPIVTEAIKPFLLIPPLSRFSMPLDFTKA